MPKRSPQYFPLTILKLHFRKPIQIAPKELSTSSNALRKSLKLHGINKWPYRYLQRLDRLINFLSSMELEQRNTQKDYENFIKTNITRRRIETLELERLPELLGLREQEELNITLQKIEFMISNTLQVSMEAMSSNKENEEINKNKDVNRSDYEIQNFTSNTRHFEMNSNPIIQMGHTNYSTPREEDERNLSNEAYWRQTVGLEDPCRTFTEFLIKLGEAGIRNLQPSTILDLAKTYYSESLRLEKMSFHV
eukprot:jgi/Galph1/3584/GphlegSOOS_G2281.1